VTNTLAYNTLVFITFAKSFVKLPPDLAQRIFKEWVNKKAIKSE
jgi:hypothetical protein